ncbi:MAG: copper transporter [Actinomycetota bacterium]|nr:copper transporter [Actinomycetota bacterium]
MINLRYHIVSLVAVFLALAVGIVMGSTLIDQAIVDGLRNQVRTASNRANRIDSENKNLHGQLDVMRGFAEEARDQLIQGRLRNLPVLVVTVQGVDRKPVEALREALAVGQAIPAGTLLFTNKLRLDNDGDVRALATALNVAPTSADAVRRQALNRLAATLGGTSGEGNLIPTLSAAGFVGYEPPSPATTTTTLGLSSFPVANLQVVLVSGAGAEVGDDAMAVPFAQALVSQAMGQSPAGASRLVAAESGQDTPGGRGVFVGPLRADGSLAPKLSTVDNLESPIGQAAVVLALEDLDVPRTGNYGVGPGAQRLLPAVEP